MYDVKILPTAEKDITDIYTYVKHCLHIPELAETFRKEIKETVDTLKENPNRGAKHYHGARKIMYKKYRIIYKVHADVVYVIGVD